MMRKFLSAFLMSCAIMNCAFAQEETASQLCAKQRTNQHKLFAKVAIADPAEDLYDISHVKMNLSLTNASATISGDVTTTAKVVASLMSSYVFELNNQLSIDSVKINNLTLSVTTNGDIRTVTLPSTFTQNSFFTAQVFYHGTVVPPSPNAKVGLRNETSPTWNNVVTYSMSEPYDSKDWWPTKQSLTDKIDSADMWITVPSNLKAGSNGLLQSITSMPNNMLRYEWKTNYPTDYYLLSVAVAEYVDYSFNAPLPNSNDFVFVQNYVYDNPQTLPFFKDRIDSIKQMIYYLSQLYGRYPFWQEKYGNCMAPLSGGMEHQTMTTQGNFGTILTVHELAHQWFGNNVTCQSWKDIWLNEAFAAYTEYLYVAHFWPPAQAYMYMFGKHNNVLLADTSTVYVSDTTNEGRIFSGRFTYDKGASIVHTLRFVFDNDSLFFQALSNYQTLYAGKTATTSDFQNIAEQTLGKDLDTFFNQWIYSPGHPVYDAKWNQVGNWVFVKLDQTSSHPSVNLFYTPVELQIFGATGDTTIRVYNNQASQTFSFYWTKPITGLLIDPNDWLLNQFGQIVKDTSLGVDNPRDDNAIVYPNPTNNIWHVKNLKEESVLQLTDINGRMVWKGSGKNNIDIDARNFPTGTYLLRIYNKQLSETIKLIKQ